jgi:RimJ/RimL family protein N-acetyltransferase
MISYKKYHPISLDHFIPSEALRWRNNPEIWKWCRQYTLISARDQQKWLEKIEEDPSIKMFSISNQAKIIGVAGFTSIDRHNRNAEFSLYIEPNSQGKGYGAKALRTLINHGFYDWGFERIWGETYQDNPAINMFARIGMKTEGMFRNTYFRNGQFINSYMVSILRGEWK